MAAVAERFLAAARAMCADGWWWHPAGATNGSVQRAIVREMLAARFPRLAAPHATRSVTIGSKSSPRST
jgi:glutamate-1-semialdehyde 2,1-aminomutase